MEWSTTEYYTQLVYFLWFVFFEKLVNNRLFLIVTFFIVTCYKNVTSFRLSWSTADLLTGVPDGIARLFHRSWATWAAALDILTLDRFWHAGLLLRPMEFQVRYLTLCPLFSVIGGLRWFGIGSIHKNIQVMLEFLKSLCLFGPRIEIWGTPALSSRYFFL